MKKILLIAGAFLFFIQPGTSYASVNIGGTLPRCACISQNKQITCDEGKTRNQCQSDCECTAGRYCSSSGWCQGTATPSFPNLFNTQKKNKNTH